MVVTKICQSCRKPFLDERREPFITCHHCRKPLARRQMADGCNSWASVYNPTMVQVCQGNFVSVVRR